MKRKIDHLIVSVEAGGHDYSAYPHSVDCQYHCGCWAGNIGYGKPDNRPALNPLGLCPENPRNRGAARQQPWER